MNGKQLAVVILPLIFLATAAGPARANHIDSADATVVCDPAKGSLMVTGSALTVGDNNYQVCFDIKLTPIPSGTSTDITGCVPVTNMSGSFSTTIPLMGAPSGDWTVTGEVFLQDTSFTPPLKGTCAAGLGLPDGDCLVTVNGASSTTLDCPGECPLTQGFWKNHPSAWPVTSLTLGTVSYTQSQLLDIFDTPVKGDASIDLAHQLIAAKLNIANGSSAAPISSTITDADGDLDGGTIPQGVKSSSTLGADMTGDASELDNFNSSKPTGCTGPS